ncbi:MAG: hypothetical protein F4051_11925 [Boseongicola sp. SB0670_bin_30]|nr:hypothetical protein [Boseongicola sp. SB0670_bin_30]
MPVSCFRRPLSRRKPKDWYDVAFVLLHNDAGGTAAAAASARGRFSGEIAALQAAINDLQANFQDADAHGTRAYVTQMHMDHPELDPETLAPTRSTPSRSSVAYGIQPIERTARSPRSRPDTPPLPLRSPACHAGYGI